MPVDPSDTRRAPAFRVTPAAVDVFADGLRGLLDDVASARHYIGGHLDISYFGDSGIFLNIAYTADNVRHAAEANLRRLHEIVDASADQLDRIADRYRATDTKHASALDGIMPGYGGGR